MAHPRAVILELDYFLFADRWDSWYATTRTMIHDRPFRYAMTSLGNFLRAAATHRTMLDASAVAPGIFVGPQSFISSEGFRADGSYAYSVGHIAQAQRAYRTAEFFSGSAPQGFGMSPSLQAPIERIAALARQRGIKIVTVQLPIVRAGIDLLEQDASYHDKAGTWRAFESPATRAWLAGLGIPLFDLAHSPIDDDPDNFVDAIHLSESGMDRAMAELHADPAFRTAIDPDTPGR